MKIKIIYAIIVTLAFNFSCQSQTHKTSTFIDVVNLFPDAKIPLKRKDGIISKINDISKSDAKKYLHLSEENLKMNNFLYNMDEDIVTDRWQDVLPGALSKVIRDKYVILIYAILKVPDIGVSTYQAWLTTFTYEGQIIDSMTVRSQYTPEVDCRDFILLENNVLRIFDYKPYLENYNIKGGAYYVIDEKQPQTEVEISDYQIDENGKINLIKTYPKQYLKEFVSFYRNYQKDSDDPMNKY